MSNEKFNKTTPCMLTSFIQKHHFFFKQYQNLTHLINFSTSKQHLYIFHIKRAKELEFKIMYIYFLFHYLY